MAKLLAAVLVVVASLSTGQSSRLTVRVAANPGIGNFFDQPGAIFAITSGSCPSGSSEATDLAGVVLQGTTTGAGDINTGGGSDTLTPAGTNSAPTFTGSALGTHTHAEGSFSAAAQTFTGTAFSGVINHTHTINITDGGHAHVQAVNTASTGPNAGYGFDASTNTTSTSGYSTASATTGITAASVNPAGGVANITPAGTNGSSAVSGTSGATSGGTPAGTNSAPTFTGDSADNRQAFLRVIYCRVNAEPVDRLGAMQTELQQLRQDLADLRQRLVYQEAR